MRKLVASLVLMVGVLGAAGCHTCDVCDDCGDSVPPPEVLGKQHHKARKGGCATCGDAVVAPMTAELVPTPVTK